MLNVRLVYCLRNIISIVDLEFFLIVLVIGLVSESKC